MPFRTSCTACLRNSIVDTGCLHPYSANIDMIE